MLAGISSASIQGRIALGPRAGRRVWRVGEEPDAPWVLSSSPRHAHIAGFDLHANAAVPAGDRGRLEQLCRYLLRPPVAQERVRRMGDDRILLTLKAAWADGTRHLMGPSGSATTSCSSSGFPVAEPEARSLTRAAHRAKVEGSEIELMAACP